MTDRLLVKAFEEHQDRLLNLAQRNMPVELQRLFTPEDILQETLVQACQKADFLESHPEIPVYFKLRIVLFQTLGGLVRRHLQADKRSLQHEVSAAEKEDASSRALLRWEDFSDTLTSPLSRITRAERHSLLRSVMESLPEADREILLLRHFDGLSIQACAEALHITPKAASMRHVRAVQRLQERLLERTEFRP